MELKEYIKEEIGVLKDLGLWKYCNDDERTAIRKAQSKSEISRLMRTYRDRYYDIMLADYEAATTPEIVVSNNFNLIVDNSKILSSSVNMPILDLPLKNRTINALMRNNIKTLQEFANFVSEHGWNKLRHFGQGCAEEVLSQIVDVDHKALAELVEKLKEPQKNIKKYKM